LKGLVDVNLTCTGGGSKFSKLPNQGKIAAQTA